MVIYMDLLQLFQREMDSQQINKKLEIARYLYIRTGEIFEYDPFYAFASVEEAKQISEKRLDMRKITDFRITCTSWSYLYVDLLKAFHISAEVVERNGHAYVVIFIDKKTFLADLTNDNEDLMRIKFKLKTIFQRQIAPEAPKVESSFDIIDEKIYRRGRKTEEGIYNVKRYLKELKTKLPKETVREDYAYVVFKTIEQMLPSYKIDNIGIVSGTKFIEHLLLEFEVDYPFSFKRLYDRKTGNCSHIYIIKHNGKEHFFSYDKQNNLFVFQEKLKEEFLKMDSSCDLKLSKKDNKITNNHLMIS